MYQKGEEILVRDREEDRWESRIFHSMDEDKVLTYANVDIDGYMFFRWPLHRKKPSARFSEAQVGDLVYNRLCGYGVIREIERQINYSLQIRMENDGGHESSTIEGLYRVNDVEPTWFYVNPKNKEDKYLEERPNGAYVEEKPSEGQSSIEWIRENLSNRSNEWLRFSALMVSHIESYTVPQYGDTPGDQAEGWTAEDCFKSIERYLNRRNSQSREGQDLLDIKKMAHYLCLAYFKKEAWK